MPYSNTFLYCVAAWVLLTTKAFTLEVSPYTDFSVQEWETTVASTINGRAAGKDRMRISNVPLWRVGFLLSQEARGVQVELRALLGKSLGGSYRDRAWSKSNVEHTTASVYNGQEKDLLLKLSYLPWEFRGIIPKAVFVWNVQKHYLHNTYEEGVLSALLDNVCIRQGSVGAGLEFTWKNYSFTELVLHGRQRWTLNTSDIAPLHFSDFRHMPVLLSHGVQGKWERTVFGTKVHLGVFASYTHTIKEGRMRAQNQNFPFPLGVSLHVSSAHFSRMGCFIQVPLSYFRTL